MSSETRRIHLDANARHPWHALPSGGPVHSDRYRYPPADSGRRCVCGTVLSRWNPQDVCSACERAQRGLFTKSLPSQGASDRASDKTPGKNPVDNSHILQAGTLQK